MNPTTEILLRSTMQNMRPTLHLVLLVKLMKDYSGITSLDIDEMRTSITLDIKCTSLMTNGWQVVKVILNQC